MRFPSILPRGSYVGAARTADPARGVMRDLRASVHDTATRHHGASRIGIPNRITATVTVGEC